LGEFWIQDRRIRILRGLRFWFRFDPFERAE
jgi:hypothetical protein